MYYFRLNATLNAQRCAASARHGVAKRVGCTMCQDYCYIELNNLIIRHIGPYFA